MKKLTAVSTLIAGLAILPQASADTLLGVYAGAHVWGMSSEGGISDSGNILDFNYDEEQQTTLYVAIEHFVPLVPNLKVRHNTMETQGNINTTASYVFNGETFSQGAELASTFDVTNTDFVLYYEILDFDIASLDIGVNVKHLDGTVGVASVDQTQAAMPLEFTGIVPMAYAKVEVGLPLTGLGAYAEANVLSVGDHSVYDYQAAIVYEVIDNLAVDVELQLGYRMMGLELDDLDGIYSDLEFNGVYAGMQVHF